MPIRLAASQTEGYYTGVQCGCGRCVSWRRVTGVGGRGTRTPHEYPPTRSPGDFDGGGAPLEQHSEPRRPPAPWSGRRFAHGSPGPGLPPPPASHLTGAPQSTDWAPPAADTTPSRGSENCALIDWRNTPPAVVGGGGVSPSDTRCCFYTFLIVNQPRHQQPKLHQPWPQRRYTHTSAGHLAYRP